MNIGIITQPLHNNYGGLLQNYALQQVIREMGHEPITLDWGTRKLTLIKRLVTSIQVWIKCITRGENNRDCVYTPTENEEKVISRNTNLFLDKYIHRTSKSFSSEDLYNNVVDNNLKALVVGSDQVWRPQYSGIGITNMYLSFIPDPKIKRIAYAASFGTDLWEYTDEQTNECRKLAQLFDYVSVREDSGVDLCRDYLGISADYVLDPTLLLARESYENIINESEVPQSKGNLFYYILDPSSIKESFINDAGEKYGLTPFTIMPKHQAENRTKKQVKRDIENCIFPSVSEWLRAFLDAKMVICDSFHGCVFSIIFNKPFWVLENAGRGNARFSSLLRTFDLSDRLITPNDVIALDKEIDWKRINHLIEEKRRYSIKRIHEALLN